MEFSSYRYRIEPREIDFSKCATLVAVSDHILHAAGEDADRRGFGVRDLNHDNTSWVLSRMAVELVRFPVQYEEFQIDTWVEEVNRLMTTRNFVLKDLSGNAIGGASTYWSKIDLSTRMPVDLRSDSHYLTAANGVVSPIKKPVKVAAVGTEAAAHRKVVYSDIDFNQHANSMKYLQWMLDLLPLEYFSERRFERVDINYLHEARFGDSVEIAMAHDDDFGNVSFEVRRGDATVLCRASITSSK